VRSVSRIEIEARLFVFTILGEMRQGRNGLSIAPHFFFLLPPHICYSV